MDLAFVKNGSHSSRRRVNGQEGSCLRRCGFGVRGGKAMDTARILAVDDDARQLAAIKRCLRRSRFEVDTAHGGKVGLRMAREHPPDIVLLDVSMPTMSGYEFLRRFRRLDSGDGTRFDTIPVIFLTALASPHQKAAGLNSDVVDYITKPFDAEELRARIRNQLRHHHREEHALGTIEGEAGRLRAALEVVEREARACSQPLRELQENLNIADHVRRSALQRDIIARAKKDVGRLMCRMVRIAKCIEGDETPMN